MGFILIYLILFLSSFSLYCYKKAQNPLQLNWHHVNWEWSNFDYLDLDSSRSHLFHHSAHHFNLPLQMDQLQSSPHVWDNIRKNRRGEKCKETQFKSTWWTTRKPSVSYENNLWNELPKGQLILKGLYDVFKSTKKPMFFLKISTWPLQRGWSKN